jgi:nicotinamidase-related amidase
MIKGAKILGVPIIWTEQVPEKLGPTIPEIRELLTDNQPLIKSSFSCCGSRDFMTCLAEMQREQIIIIGMEAHICVYQTAKDLRDHGLDVYLVADAISSRDPENIQISIEAIREYATNIVSVEMALFDMMRVAEGETFRQLARIVK